MTKRFALVAAALLAAAPAAAEELTVATFLPPTHHTNAVVFKWLGEELAKRSNGTLTLKVYPGGQLGASDSSRSIGVVRTILPSRT